MNSLIYDFVKKQKINVMLSQQLYIGSMYIYPNFLNISISDIFETIYFKKGDTYSCFQMMKFIASHEIGHYYFAKNIGKYIIPLHKLYKFGTCMIISYYVYKIIQNIKNNEKYKKILKYIAIILCIIMARRSSYYIFSQLEEIYCDLFAATLCKKGGILFFNNVKSISFMNMIINKLISTHPLDISRYHYINSNDIDLSKKNIFIVFYYLIKIYLCY